MRIGAARLLTLFLILFSLCGSPLSSREASAELLPIQVGTEYSYPPFVSITPEGLPEGFSIDLVTAALAVMGYVPEFRVGTWEEVRGMLENGEVELLPLVGRTPERERLYDFTFPYITMRGAIVSRSADRFGTIDEVATKVIGVMAGDNAQEYLTRIGYDDQMVLYPSFNDALLALSEGQVDAVVIQRFLALQLIEGLGLDSLSVSRDLLTDFEQKFCFAVAEGNDQLLGVLNEGLATIIADGTFQRIQDSWFVPEYFAQGRRTTLIIGGDDSYPPYEYLDEDGEPTGFNVELTRLIAEYLNLEVEIRLEPWNKTYEDLLSGKVDLVQGLFYSPHRDQTLTFSQPHTMISHTPFTRKNPSGFADKPFINSWEELSRYKILVMRDDIMHQRALEEGLDPKMFILVESIREGLVELSEGTGDYLLAARVPSLYYIEELELENIKVGGLPLESSEYCYGALEGRENLTSFFTEGIAILSKTGELRELSSKWLGEENDVVTKSELRKILFFIILPLVLIILLSWLWSRMLHNQVDKQTFELEKSAKELKERVAELNSTKEELSESEQRFSYAVEGTRDGLWDWDMRSGFTYHSDQYARMLDYEPQEIEYTHDAWQKLVHPEDNRHVARILETCIREKRGIYQAQYRLKAGDGSYRYIYSRAKIIYDGQAEAIRMVGFDSDITSQIEGQRLIEQKERKFEELFENLIDPVCIIDLHGLILEVNSAGVLLAGKRREELVGSSVIRILSDKEYFKPRELLRTLLIEHTSSFQTTLIDSKGKAVVHEVSLRLIRYEEKRVILAMSRDITERLVNEEKQLQAAKLDSIGLLAGGIAHDFNNLLGGLFGYLELASISIDEEHPARSYLEQALSIFSRTKGLTDQLLTFSKGGAPKMEQGDLKQTVVDAARFALSGANILCEYDLTEQECQTSYDPGQIAQVIENIMINAIQAMPDGGTISLTIRKVVITDDGFDRSDGDYIEIVLEDRGAGMPKEVLEHIFDPYYTTKEHGSGLGLATSYSIITRHGGYLQATSEVGLGSIFTIDLPVVIERQDKEVAQVEERHQGQGTILIMDDETIIRDITSRMLSMMGYASVCAADGEQALSLLASQEGKEVSAALFDLTIPGGMGGKDAVLKVRELYPTLPVFASSGYSDDPVMARPEQFGFTASIAKPYRLQELSELLERYLS